MDRWDDIRVFLQVARDGSCTAAARSLEVEQSTVSRRIGRLERALGAQLFDRTPSGLRPTALGVRLLERAEGVETFVHRFVDDAAAEDRAVAGPVRIAVTEGLARHVVVPHVLPALQRTHPGIQPELIVSYRAADLLHREADIAVRFFRPRSGDLVAKRVARMSTAVLGHRDYLAGRESRSKEPAELDWIGMSAPGVPEARWLAQHIPAEPRAMTDSYATQVEMVRAGLGVALLTRSLLRSDPGLVELDLGLPNIELALWLVTHRSIRELPRVAVTFSALADALGQLDES